MSPLRVFVSYSHQDELYLAELEKHLTTLKREKLISTWHDRKIVPGQEWEKAIDGALQDSDVYVFLISPDFVASEYCIEKEVSVALEKHNSGQAIAIPIVVRSVDWLSTPLGRIQALPKDANPISVWDDKDQAWLEVVKGIRLAISDLERNREAEPKVLLTHISQALTSEIERLEIRYQLSKHVEGIPTGLHDLDYLIDGVHLGDLICVAAAPVMDRMALLISIMNGALVENSFSGLVVTLRQSRDQVTRRMCAALGKISVQALQRGELEDEDWSSLTHALGMLNDAKIGFVEQSSIDIDTLIFQIDKFRDLNDSCDLVVIDQFEHVTGGSKSNLLAALGRYARANKVAIIVATGLENDPSSRPNKRPVVSDIGEWAVLSEDLDTVIFVYQDEQYYPDSPDREIAELIVARNPRGALATIATVRLRKGQALVSAARQLSGLKGPGSR
ncbi:MAG: hypothetical protein FD134_2863 [Gallionellaceae bacterium]|nr:MAG: hypothetical protein FD134_2863 [Gallionellaceae bacterium]